MGRMRFAASVLIATVVLVGSPPASATRAARTACAVPKVAPAYVGRLERVLASGRDVWGDRLLHRRNGPTLDAARRFLPPLLYAAGHGGRPLTASGVYYLPFTLPVSVGGPRGFGLHVADGS